MPWDYLEEKRGDFNTLQSRTPTNWYTVGKENLGDGQNPSNYAYVIEPQSVNNYQQNKSSSFSVNPGEGTYPYF